MTRIEKGGEKYHHPNMTYWEDGLKTLHTYWENVLRDLDKPFINIEYSRNSFWSSMV
jgi:hypothetical protein